MKTDKLNLASFTLPSMLAKLFVLQRNWTGLKWNDLNEQTARDTLTTWSRENFAGVPEDKERWFVNNLLLFCLGQASIFDKYIDGTI